MAEKFEIPKRFTKAWWGYIYDYYRFHILTAVLILLLIGYILNTALNPVTYDANVILAADLYLSDEQSQKLEALLTGAVGDLDKNGKKEICLMNMYITDKSEANEMEMQIAYRQKLSAEMYLDENMIFIFDEKVAGQYLAQAEGGFYEIKKWAGDFDGETLSQGGKDYGASLKNSSIIKKSGIDGSKLYILVKDPAMLKKENDEKANGLIDLAKKIVDN